MSFALLTVIFAPDDTCRAQTRVKARAFLNRTRRDLSVHEVDRNLEYKGKEPEAHQMGPPSPWIFVVNASQSRVINRTIFPL